MSPKICSWLTNTWKDVQHNSLFSSVQSLSRFRLFASPWTAAQQASLSITNSRSPPKPISIETVMPSNHLILCRPLLLLPAIFPSIRVFSNESTLCIRGPNYGVSASASVLPMNIQNWFPLGWTGWILLVSKGLSRVFSNTTLQKYQFLSAYLSSQSNSHIHIWSLEKPWTRWTFVGKVMSLLFNILSRLIIAFLPRSKHLLISYIQSPSAVILEPKKIKSATVSPSICHEVMELDAWSSFSECWVLSQLFHSPLSLSSRGSLVLHFLP